MFSASDFFNAIKGVASVFTVLVCFLFTGSCQNVDDEQEVLNCFAGYKSAILESNGAEALEWVDDNTLDYYGKILKSSISADSLTIDRMNVLDKLTVLTARQYIPDDQLLEMDGRSFLRYAIDNGMVGKNSVMNMEVDEVEVNKGTAKARLYNNGVKSPVFFQFNKEGGEWKVDITSVFAPSIAGFEQAIENSGMTENQFMMVTLEYMTGEAPDKDLWRAVD